MAKKKAANPIGPAQRAFNKSIGQFPFVPLNESREMSIKELESKYKSYRKTFNERIRRMTKEGTEAQRAMAGPFATGGYKNPSTLPQMRKYAKNPEQYRRMLEKRFTELSQLMQRPKLSLQGWRAIEEKTLKTLQKSNYTNIKTREQLRAFVRYMDTMRSLWGTKEFPSDEVAEIFDLSQKNEESRLPLSELMGILEDLGFDVDELGVDLFG